MDHAFLAGITLQTPRLLIRPLGLEDAGALFAMMSDSETCSDDGGYAPYPEKDAAFMKEVDALVRDPDRYAIVLRETGETVGTLHLMDTIPERAVPALEIGYCMCPVFRRRGYASEAATELIRYLHLEMGIPLITAGAFGFNLKSQRMLEKLGFEREGVIRFAIDHPVHGMTDMICYVHLKME